jgi:hypothetical protein
VTAIQATTWHSGHCHTEKKLSSDQLAVNELHSDFED